MEKTFTVSPMNQTFDLVPGKVYDGSITILNTANSESNFDYRVSISPYNVIGENYDADLVTVSNYSMITDWIKIDNPTGTLKSNETKEINFTITVPKSAPGGGQYAALLVSENINDDNSVVSDTFEIASLIYASVSGEVKRGGEILENNIPGFVLNTPVAVSMLISNTGNVHESATVTIDVKNVITGGVILSSEQNGRYSEIIMPETTRRIERNIMDLPVVGIVNINQTIYYNGQSSIESRNVIICPIWFMILAVAMIGGTIGGIILAIKKHHKKHSVL